MKCRTSGLHTGMLALGLGLASGALEAQVLDQGTLLIRAGVREVGTETFRIVSDSGSLRITTRTTFGARAAEFSTALERSRAADAAFQLDWITGGRNGQVYAVQKRNRVTVRRVEKGAEQASELPATPRTAFVADSAFSILYQFVWLVPQGGTAQALLPIGNRRLTVTVERSASPQGTLIRLREGLEGEIELGNVGQILRIHLPNLGLEAVRKPE